MSETVQALVAAIKDGNAIATEQAFAAAMADKLSGKLDDMRANIAQSMFSQPVVAEETKMGHDHAKEVAHKIAGAHSHLAVLSDGDDHYVHHKDDENGEHPDIHVSAHGGKIHLHQDIGTSGHEESSHSDVDSAVAHAHEHMVPNIPKRIE